MPVRLEKTDGKVRVSTPGGVKAKGTTRAKAEAQRRLLQGVEHGFKPTGKRRHNPGHKPGHTPYGSLSDLRQGSPRTLEELRKGR
ncbi:hypothetical protein LCGC14_1795180 [marine sediment metagenome]|uniref:Uncharacterized protein n=1 Tax=marine sediment metagenome TaxID=412755 RepID=A0A0F9J649_9ZZZZ